LTLVIESESTETNPLETPNSRACCCSKSHHANDDDDDDDDEGKTVRRVSCRGPGDLASVHGQHYLLLPVAASRQSSVHLCDRTCIGLSSPLPPQQVRVDRRHSNIIPLSMCQDSEATLASRDARHGMPQARIYIPEVSRIAVCACVNVDVRVSQARLQDRRFWLASSPNFH